MAPERTTKGGIAGFFTHTLWEVELSSFGPLRGGAVKYLRIAVMLVRAFYDDQCLLRASALTFSTLLSIVPLFALAFAVLKGFGVQNTLEPFILDQMAAGSQEIVDKIVTYINNTKVGSLGAIGLVTLLVSVVTLLGNIEEAFNAVWGVRETRSVYRKFSDYLSVIISAPVLLFAAVSVTTTLQSQKVVQWLVGSSYFGGLLLSLFHLVPYLSIWLALVFLYVFIPNTKVHFRSALIGGLIAGTVWQVAQWGYIHFQVGVSRYNAIYGTLAVLPVFMVWLYTSWMIVLFGVEVVYAHQHQRTLLREVHTPTVSYAVREQLALALLLEIAWAFWTDRPPWNAELLAERLKVPERMVRELLDQLIGAGWVAAGGDGEPTYLPARELGHIRVREVVDSVKAHGVSSLVEWAEDPLVAGLCARIDGTVADALGELSFRDLVQRRSDAPEDGGVDGRNG
ncbi:hypothetical protein GURASL_27790 [Geotalea uraniireducens]|uniref:Uncharacterized protein n=1 Tax=Geotalea uraniireducens TaxID=351604 RepID=A0ABM8EN26_9BACT|nr:YhjD/YihY/BrkB family envelope integrity protein [Geotalea uraniireducens]BDV43856.1 hypothetical protein GURASL_27790 [Geotalea uraniireducens]